MPSPAFLALQKPSVSGNLSLQPHLGVEQLAVALALGGQPAPHLLQLALQPSDHLGKVMQLAGVHLLGVLKGAFKAFLLHTRQQRAVRIGTGLLYSIQYTVKKNTNSHWLPTTSSTCCIGQVILANIDKLEAEQLGTWQVFWGFFGCERCAWLQKSR